MWRRGQFEATTLDGEAVLVEDCRRFAFDPELRKRLERERRLSWRNATIESASRR
jgi:hypothetical protein